MPGNLQKKLYQGKAERFNENLKNVFATFLRPCLIRAKYGPGRARHLLTFMDKEELYDKDMPWYPRPGLIS